MPKVLPKFFMSAGVIKVPAVCYFQQFESQIFFYFVPTLDQFILFVEAAGMCPTQTVA
jgi:hypothetical protein